VGDEDDLGAPEVVPGPEEDPGEEEEVIQDEVGGYIGSGCDQNIVLGEKVPNIAELREEKKDPGIMVRVVVGIVVEQVEDRIWARLQT
jgi:hypothetical protein